MRAQAATSLAFRILGPLAALRGGEPISLGGDRQRALLAILLVHGNEALSTERLIEQLFGSSGSERSANALHVAMSRLRRTLRDSDGTVLLTRPGGYVLELEPDQLDAEVFERRVEGGRACLARGDAAGARARLTEALTLWRGAPFSNVPTVDDVQGEVKRLEELRLLAEMERVEAELRLGHAGEAVVELERLIALAPLQERLRGQLMLALYRSGRQADALAAYRDACTLLREEVGLTPSAELRELERMILRHDPRLDGGAFLGAASASPPASDRTQTVVCPFKGLASFESSDSEFFCGRRRVVSELIARSAEWPLVGILGPSGIGKSSLLRAGVLPALRGGALPGSTSWRQVLLRPGRRPCEALERALDGDLARAVSGLARGERIVIAIDQLEELFTVCEEETERREFLEALVSAAGDHERRVLVLSTLRADFYGRLSAYPSFAGLLSSSHALVGPMERAELREVIEQPAARAGLEVEDGLVEALVADVADEPGCLPLLSTALLELWQARDGRTLRLQDYRATGGVRGAVARIAEAAYLRLPEGERPVARELLLRLADFADGQPERRLLVAEDIERISGGAQVLAALTDARLVTVGAGGIELSHEALLREWPRYREWFEEDRVGRRVHGHLRAAAREWDARGRDPGELYRGARLAAAIEFRAERPEWMDPLERAFVVASQRQADREAARQRAQNRRLRALLVGVGVLLILTSAAAIVAVVAQRRATGEAHAALGRQLGAEALGEARLDVAALLAREAVALDHSSQTEGTLLSTLLRSPAVVGTFPLPTNSTPHVAVSPDGRTLAVSDTVGNAVRFYDTLRRAAEPRQLSDFSGHQPPAYSADGTLLVYPAGQFLAVRDARTLSLRARLIIGAPFAPEVAADIPGGSILVAPDARTVYYAYWLVDPGGQPSEAYLARWALPSGRPLSSVPLGRGPLLAVRLIEPGGRLMVLTAHSAQTYVASTLRRVGAVALRPAPLLPSAGGISPDGTAAAIGSQTGSVWFVNTATGGVSRGQGGHTAPVDSAEYAPGGGAAITVGDDGRVFVWDPRSGAEDAALPGPPGHVQNAQVSPDGSTLYTAGVGGSVLAWDLTGQRAFGRSAPLSSPLPCCDPVAPPGLGLAISPDGSEFAVATGASTVGVFSARTLERRASFSVARLGGSITALAWSPAGRVLAVGAHDGVVQLWDVRGPPRLVRLLAARAPLPQQPTDPDGQPQTPPASSDAIQAIAFSPDGRLLAATDKIPTTTVGRTLVPQLATMTIWQVGTGDLDAPAVDLGTGNNLNGSSVLAFSHDGRLLAASLLTGGVRIFDPAGGRALRTLVDPGDNATSLAFAPNGALAEGTLGGNVELWNPVSGRRLAAPLVADSSAITGIAFDPSGARFAVTGYQDGIVKIWFSATLDEEGPPLSTDPGAAVAAAFDRGENALLAVDNRGHGFSWPSALSFWEQRACTLAARSLTSAQSGQSPALPDYSVLCR